MGSMLSACVVIEGVRPMLWHAFGPDSIPTAEQKLTIEKTGVAGNDPEEWKRTVLMTADRQLYIKPSYVFGCLRDAAKYTKRGRGTLMVALAGTLQCVDPILLVDRYVPDEPTYDPNELVYIDVSGVKNPQTKGRNVRYRVACSIGWHLSFNVIWDKTEVQRAELEKVVQDAGQKCGLGDGRAIGNGRFKMLHIEFADA